MSTPTSGTPEPAPGRVTCSCPICGALTLPVEAFLLVHCEWNTDRSFYTFTCTRCEEPIIKQASQRVVTGLITRGVRAVAFPAEALEVADLAGHSRLTSDDLLDLMVALADDETVATAIAKVSLEPGQQPPTPAPGV